MELTADGSALRIEPVSAEAVEERGGRLVIPASGEPITVAEVEALRDADRR